MYMVKPVGEHIFTPRGNACDNIVPLHEVQI